MDDDLKSMYLLVALFPVLVAFAGKPTLDFCMQYARRCNHLSKLSEEVQ